ncbi:MAG TPA: phosphatase PAP2/dual specificity phosphatase family protein [Thermoanaerobaculia bacterium]|nr:phosphatase PAP2/dual specificity phosphatase family protein [Thermoanaerobaculia bacterium]
MPEPRPWKRAVAWLVFVGPFFFASYGFANWLASRRSHVGAIVFGWERAIPFWAWTIIPYWSIDVLYAISFFICTTKREVDRHAQRLLLAQLISVAFFIALPLRFTFDRPHADGVFGALFTALGSFDKPFNQAPSLHISLLIVLWVRYAAHMTRHRWLLHAWMTLIGFSILTTYQHHFIDLPTGLAAGFVVLWLLPDDAPSPLRGMRFTRERRARQLALAYLIGAMLLIALTLLGGAWLWLWWPAGALAMVALHYGFTGARGFQKDAHGQHTLGTRGLMAPYLVAARANSRLWTRNHPPSVEVLDGVSIGRVPSPRELQSFDAIVDLAPEVACAQPGTRAYRCVPSLDLVTPDAETLRAAATAIEEVHAHGRVLVCCALGYSRSAAAVAAWLLMTRRAASAEEAAAIVRRARPYVVLGPTHLRALASLA